MLAQSEVRLDTNLVDYAILAIYFVAVLGIGFAAKRYIKTSLDYFLSGPLAARVDHGPGLHLGQPGRARGARHGGQRRPVRRLHRPLLLDRRGAGHGLPRHRDDALLLRLQGPIGAGVPAPALQQADAPLQRADLRVRDRADRRREPVRARARAQADAGLADPARHRRRRRRRARLHHARRPLLGDLQRGAAVLRDPRRPDPADHRRAARRRRLGGPQGGGRDQDRRRPLPLVAGHGGRQRRQPARRVLGPDRLRPRLRALVRVLDDELRGGPARAQRQEPERGAPHAADRGLPEGLHPRRDDHPRPRRARDDPGPRRRRSRQGVQQRDPAADERVPAQRHARDRARGPAGGVHGGRRGERVGLQHGRHLRPLGALRHAPARATTTTSGSAVSRRSRAS